MSAGVQMQSRIINARPSLSNVQVIQGTQCFRAGRPNGSAFMLECTDKHDTEGNRLFQYHIL